MIDVLISDLQTDTKDQLRNLQNIQLYNYRYTEEFANSVGIEDPSRIETGVIAQELEVVIPEAVKTTSDVRLASGEIINELKVVDKVQRWKISPEFTVIRCDGMVQTTLNIL